jgi:hypothetical protein
LGNTCPEGQIDGMTRGVRRWGYEPSHSSLSPAKLAGVS